MPGGSKKGGGLEVKKSTYGAPYQMKGSPMKRNFGIGETEAPDTETPLNLDLGATLSNFGKSANWGDIAKKSLAAGMRTLKGGYDAYKPSTTSTEDANKLAMEHFSLQLDEMGEEERELWLKDNPEFAKIYQRKT